ncbi:MAG: hypothetical protein D6698_10195 [Gammaproteobacteria bacterium]|nr:MAG: hypothetical protein D6698_10195 [Gammaproteobacteria bacterium]
MKSSDAIDKKLPVIPLLMGFLTLAFLGFYETYFKQFSTDFSGISWSVHWHAGLWIAWVLFVFTQWSLAKSARLRLHRQLGRAGFFLFPLILLGVLPLLYSVWQRGDGFMLFISVSDMVLLMTFFTCGMVWRKNTQVHKCFMLATLLVLLDPIVGRVALNLLTLPVAWANHLPFLLTDGFILIMLLRDSRRGLNVLPWNAVLACFLLYQGSVYFIGAQLL